MLRDGLLDSSNYPENHPLYSTKYRSKLGCVKDESCGKTFNEWIFLRPKCYSLRYEDGDVKKTAKGVQRYIHKFVSMI